VYDGRSLREDNGNELLYYHWGKMRHRKLRWPTFEEAENGFAFDRYGFYDVELGRARQAARRAVGRAVELTGDVRNRLSKWRAARRAGALPAGSQMQSPEAESS
jgi:hypothetical protein